MEQSQGIKEKILQMSAKAKMITAGAIVAVCAVGSLAYYISIPKLSDVEKYQSNHDVAGMTKLITETMKSGNKYKDVQDNAIQALAGMKDATGSNFLIDYVTNFDKGATVEEKKEIFEAVQKNDPDSIENNADKLFDYAVDQASDAGFADEILNVIVEDHPDYIQKNADKMTDTVVNKSLSEAVKAGIIDDLIKSNPNYLQTVADKFLSGISGDNTKNLDVYKTLTRFSINGETSAYITARVRKSIAGLVSSTNDETKVINTVQMLDSLRMMPVSISGPLNQYGTVKLNLENFDEKNNVQDKIKEIDDDIKSKRARIAGIEVSVPVAEQVGRQEMQRIYMTQGIHAALEYHQRYSEQYEKTMKEYYDLHRQIANLEGEKNNVAARIANQRKELENRKISLYNQIRNAALAFSSGEVINEVSTAPAPVNTPAVPRYNTPSGNAPVKSFNEYLALKDGYNGQISSLAQETNEYITAHGNLKDASNLLRKSQALQESINETLTQYRADFISETGRNTEVRKLLEELFQLEAERVSALVNGLMVGVGGSPDYAQEFQKGTKAAYEFDDGDGRLKTVLK